MGYLGQLMYRADGAEEEGIIQPRPRHRWARETETGGFDVPAARGEETPSDVPDMPREPEVRRRRPADVTELLHLRPDAPENPVTMQKRPDRDDGKGRGEEDPSPRQEVWPMTEPEAAPVPRVPSPPREALWQARNPGSDMKPVPPPERPIPFTEKRAPTDSGKEGEGRPRAREREGRMKSRLPDREKDTVKGPSLAAEPRKPWGMRPAKENREQFVTRRESKEELTPAPPPAPSALPVRTRTPAEKPRLVIERLKVEVVHAKPREFRERREESRTAVHRAEKDTQRPVLPSRLRFGFGQM